MDKLIAACYVGVTTRLLVISGYYEIGCLLTLVVYLLIGG